LFKKLQALDPTFPWPHSFLARIYLWTGNHAAAVEEHAKGVELDGNLDNAKLLRDTFATGGWDAFWRESARQRTGLGTIVALATANESEKEVAVKRLMAQAEKGGFWLFLIKTDPLYDPLRGDPRFQELLK